jgi:GATA-binding protein
MKKTVIKRRKRVPAAAGASGRLSDQAAAEALVAVARLGVGNGSAQGGGDESEGDAEQPKKKRARRTKTKSGSRKERDDEDIGMDGMDDGADSGSGRLSTNRSKDTSGPPWGDIIGDARPASRRDMHVTDAGHAGSSSSTASPTHDHQQRAQSIPRVIQGPETASLEGRYAAHAHLQRGFGSPHPHGGFDLPPLNAALGGGEVSGGVAGVGGRGYGAYGFSGTPSSYMRSGSSAPSRTHSPLGPAGMGTGAGTYLLPLPHMQGLPHSHPYYSGVGSSSQPPGMAALQGSSPPPPGHDVMSIVGGGVPTIIELERHYFELHEQRRKLEDMMEKTDRMIVGVKRGIEEMKGVGQTESQTPPGSSAAGANLVPLRAGAGTGAGVERERSRDSVWPVVDSTSRE